MAQCMRRGMLACDTTSAAVAAVTVLRGLCRVALEVLEKPANFEIDPTNVNQLQLHASGDRDRASTHSTLYLGRVCCPLGCLVCGSRFVKEHCDEKEFANGILLSKLVAVCILRAMRCVL